RSKSDWSSDVCSSDLSKVKLLQADLANLKEERNELNAKWQSEKEVVDNVQALKKQIEDYKLQAERAEREGDFGKVAELRYGKIKIGRASCRESEKDTG